MTPVCVFGTKVKLDNTVHASYHLAPFIFKTKIYQTSGLSYNHRLAINPEISIFSQYFAVQYGYTDLNRFYTKIKTIGKYGGTLGLLRPLIISLLYLNL